MIGLPDTFRKNTEHGRKKKLVEQNKQTKGIKVVEQKKKPHTKKGPVPLNPLARHSPHTCQMRQGRNVPSGLPSEKNIKYRTFYMSGILVFLLDRGRKYQTVRANSGHLAILLGKT